MERWRDTGRRGYEISDQAQVRSRSRIVKGKNGSSRFIQGQVLKPVVHHGRAYVNLWRGNCYERVRVDKLMAEAFGVPMPALSLRRKLLR